MSALPIIKSRVANTNRMMQCWRSLPRPHFKGRAGSRWMEVTQGRLSFNAACSLPLAKTSINDSILLTEIMPHLELTSGYVQGPLSPLNCYWTFWLNLYFTHCKLSRSCFARRNSSLWLKPNAVNCVAEMKRFARFNVISLNAIFMWSCIPSNVDLQVFHDKKYGTPLAVLEQLTLTTYLLTAMTCLHYLLFICVYQVCLSWNCGSRSSW